MGAYIATASGDRAIRLETRRFHRLCAHSGLFFADLLNAVRPGCIKREVLANTPAGRTGSQWEEDKRHDEKKANAKYVLTVARKLGCAVFLT